MTPKRLAAAIAQQAFAALPALAVAIATASPSAPAVALAMAPLAAGGVLTYVLARLFVG